jgi:hypothetical protein
VRGDVAGERGRDAAGGLEPLAEVRLHVAGDGSAVGARCGRAGVGGIGSAERLLDSRLHAVVLILRLGVVVDELGLVGTERPVAARAGRLCRTAGHHETTKDHHRRPEQRNVRELHQGFPPFGYAEPWSTVRAVGNGLTLYANRLVFRAIGDRKGNARGSG